MKRPLTAGLLVLALAACDNDSTGSGGGITQVTIAPNDPIVGIGQTVTLSATTRDQNGQSTQNAQVNWSSLNAGVASVSGSGVVTGVAAGTAQVVASKDQKADTVTVSVVSGQVLTINTSTASACDVPENVTARVAATSNRAIILADVANPAGGFTDAEYAEMAQTFDNLIWPSDTENFGMPTDIDNNGKVHIIFTRAVNAMTPANVNYIVGGFFYVRDLFPKQATQQLQACPSSNQTEIFYMLAPDPNGAVNGNVRSKNYVRSSSLATLAHEFQHLINSGRRLIINRVPGNSPWEEVWLDEGLSHVAEELAFYRITGLAPGQNLGEPQVDANGTSVHYNNFIQYQWQNAGRYRSYLQSPENQSPIDASSVGGDYEDLETRGAIWSFLRYAADRKGGDQRALWQTMVNTSLKGVPNLSANFGGDVQPWLRDWHISVYADDAVAGLEARYTQPSWNDRSLQTSLPGFNASAFPLAVQTLASGATSNMTLKAGSGAYRRFGVAAGQRAELRTFSGGTPTTAACTGGLNLAVGQVHTTTGDQAELLCVNGGAAGSEYVYIPFFAAPLGTLSASVQATNVVPVVGPPSPSRAPSFSSDLGARYRKDNLTELFPQGDGGFHLRLRHRERAELSRLIPGAGPSHSVQAAAPAPASMMVSIVRTK